MIIYTSYFYQVRFFPPNLIPLSTAVWDPKWFHDNKGQRYQFKDKRGVINGIRSDIFAPGQDCNGYCGPTCGMEPGSCDFLLRYRAQLQRLDFEEVMQRFRSPESQILSNEKNIKDVNFALLVHEAPTNKCSERVPIQEWFASHGVQVTEWSLSSI
jgi:hypothetical protein